MSNSDQYKVVQDIPVVKINVKINREYLLVRFLERKLLIHHKTSKVLAVVVRLKNMNLKHDIAEKVNLLILKIT
jgi:hypothetical protein